MNNSELRFEERTRDSIARQLRTNLAKCRRVILDDNMDLKIKERWIQLYNNTSQVLNQILKDRQLRDMERRLDIIEEYRKGKGRSIQLNSASTLFSIATGKNAGTIEASGSASKQESVNQAEE